MDSKDIVDKLRSILTKLEFTENDFISYMICGKSSLNSFSPIWLLKLDSCNNMQSFFEWYQIQISRFTKADGTLTNLYVQEVQELFLGCLLTFFLHIPYIQTDLERKFKNITPTIWTFYLTQPFYKAIQFFLKHMQIPLTYPPVNVHIKPISIGVTSKCIGIKPKIHNKISLSVRAPSLRTEIKDTFLQHGNIMNLDHDLALRDSLQKHSKDVPCGSPFDEMIKVLCFNSIIRCKLAVFPSDLETVSQEIYVKTLAYNALSCIISLPIFCKTVIKAGMDKVSVSQKIVICLECGHCLNFGRGKFKKTNFKPTHLFYCRDQREKQFTICASTGRVYCSYCGCANIRILPMIYAVGEHLYIRAVIANNAAVTLNNSEQELSVVVPCLSKSNCSACILKKITLVNLIYLTTSLDNFYCLRCSNLKL